MFDYISAGCGRKVYALDDNTVLKIPHDPLWGMEQCQTEINMFELYGDILPLCPIDLKYSSNERIIMKRITPIFDASHEFNFSFSQISDMIKTIELSLYSPDWIASLPFPLRNFTNKIVNSGLTEEEIGNIMFDVSISNMGIDYETEEILILDYGVVKK